MHREMTAGLIALLTAGLVLLLPGQAPAQMVEERDRDEPPAERPAAVPEATTPDLVAVEELVVERTNRFRKEHELNPVEPDRKLNETAQYFADFMARTSKYGHTADGKRPSERAENHGYEYCIVAENIAYQFRSTGFTAEELAKRFVSGWKQSPEHRKNMLDPDVTETGLAIARKEGSPTYFAVQMFGRPESKSVSFEITNTTRTKVDYTVSRRGSEKTFPLAPRMRRTHRRCRPTTIDLDQPDKSLKVEDGAEYVVEQSAGGEIEVTRRDAET